MTDEDDHDDPGGDDLALDDIFTADEIAELARQDLNAHRVRMGLPEVTPPPERSTAAAIAYDDRLSVAERRDRLAALVRERPDLEAEALGYGEMLRMLELSHAGGGDQAAEVRAFVERAVDAAAAGDPYTAGRREHALVLAVQAQLDRLLEIETSREARARTEGWTRRPGGIDLRAVCGDVRIGLEFKLGDVGQGLWDAIKLCGESYELRALVTESTDRVWANEATALAPLFSAVAVGQTFQTGELMARWPIAWRNLIIGGRGIRPTACVEGFTVVGVHAAPLAAHPGHTIKVCWIEPVGAADQFVFDDDGWPVSLGPAPSAFLDTVRAAVENAVKEGADRALAWPPDGAGPLSYEDLPLRLPRGRAHEAMRRAWPRISGDDRARVLAELRRRGWTIDEFRMCGMLDDA